MIDARFRKRGRLPMAAALVASAMLPAATQAQQGPGAPHDMGAMGGMSGGGMMGMDHAGMPSAAWMPGMGRDPAPHEMVARLEIDFLAGMIPHHRDSARRETRAPHNRGRHRQR